MPETNILYLTILASSIGMGYFIYGKKAGKLVPLVSGTILMIYPYFITNFYYFMIIGAILLIIPIFIKIDF